MAPMCGGKIKSIPTYLSMLLYLTYFSALKQYDLWKSPVFTVSEAICWLLYLNQNKNVIADGVILLIYFCS